MSDPSLTIIVPTYNQGRWIETALRSILEQEGPPSEVLVYDAVSQDDTPDILRRFEDRITWRREKDAGQADAINRGLREAAGDLVAWLNSDDAYLPGTFARVRAAFASDPELDFVYGDALEIDAEGRILTPNIFTEDPSPERFLYSHDFICQPTLFFRRRILQQVGPLRTDLRWFLDYQWLTRFFAAGLKGGRLPHFLAANRDYLQTKTNSGGWKRWREIIGVLSSNPGPFVLRRRCTWIYSLEFLIKGINATQWGTRPDSGRYTQRNRRRLLDALNKRFISLVQPRSYNEIVLRFQKEILPLGSTIEELWQTHR